MITDRNALLAAAGEIDSIANMPGLQKDFMQASIKHFIKQKNAPVLMEAAFRPQIERLAERFNRHINMFKAGIARARDTAYALGEKQSDILDYTNEQGQLADNAINGATVKNYHFAEKIAACTIKLARLRKVSDDLGLETSLNRRPDPVLMKMFELDVLPKI